MTYGRILLIAALVLGAIYYYHSHEVEREKEAYFHQLDLRAAAQRDREAEWEHQKELREEAEQKCQSERDAIQEDRRLSEQEKLRLLYVMRPSSCRNDKP
jgi:uncharacterized protein HemX